MQYLLQNKHLRAVIKEKGAEVVSLQRNGEEYLWNADARYWGRTSPVLFPIVGLLKNGQYRHEGKTYTMGQHGFARDMVFSVTQKSDTQIAMQITDTEETYEKYPFHFRLTIRYRLEEETLRVIWMVENTDDKQMYFSIGAHPGFFCPHNGQGTQSEYFIRFTKHGKAVERVESSLFGTIGLSEEKQVYHMQDGILPIDAHLFDREALILENNQVQEISLLNPKKEPYVTVAFDTPLVGIWSPPKKEAPFVCIEPWYGRCDKESFDGEFAQREWTNSLNPGEIFEGSYTISVY
ncbi:MAG: aldose 1-epimerase family protein [Lachnospiraceae bacterium]|nr:aldose 1-epimerase family protein [Lachnospiraceae bacterium]